MTCRNCGAELAAEYCGTCGQRRIDPDPTLREFLHELAEQLLQWDGRIAGTFRLLVTRPGELTREYLAGRRVRYLSPLRLYLLCSVLYFFLSALVPRTPARTMSGGAVATQIGPLIVKESDSSTVIAALDTLAAHGSWVGRVWTTQYTKAMRDRAALGRQLAASVPKTMFVLVPLFAALVGLVHWRSGRRYPQHLAFALHVHAFLFLALTVMLARRLTTSAPLLLLLQLPILAAILIYFVRAERRVYGGSRSGAIARVALLSFTYFLAFLAAILLTFTLTILMA